MLVLFLVAAAIVAPWGIVTVRRVLAERRARELARVGGGGTAPTDVPPDGPDASHAAAGGAAAGGAGAGGAGAGGAGVDGIDVAVALATMRAEADHHGPGDEFCLELPSEVTLGGRPADAALVSRLVVDDLRRSGIEVIDVVAGGEGTCDGTALRCRRP
jgi:hypothetical protein